MSLALPCLRRRRLPDIRLRVPQIQLVRRNATNAPDYDTLPPHESWRSLFSSSSFAMRDRVSLANPKTSNLVARSFMTGKSAAAGKGKIVIEAFPGPGALSRALLGLKGGIVKKLIILEDCDKYLPYLYSLEKADPRVVVVPKSGYDWETYIHLEEQGLLSEIETVPWDGGVHPNLHFITHIPHTILGEQLVAQFFRNIPDRCWLFKYGRVPMSFVLGEWIWERATAPSGKNNIRCKLSVIAEATAEMHASMAPAKLLPYDLHFHPRMPKQQQEKGPDSRRVGHPLVTANVIPYEEQVIRPGLLDKWDYCLRRLFVRKGTPLKNAITTLGPGAESIIRVLTNPALPPTEHVDVTKTVRECTIADWALIVRAFDNWPFAPETLSLHEAFGSTADGRRKK